MGFEYPPFIRNLPQADIPFEGVKGYILPSEHGQMVFFDIAPIGAIPEHSHGEQWGFVISGSMKLTLGGETRVLTKGDNYYVPNGVPHLAEFLTKFFAVDFFAESDRYKIKV